MSGMKRLPLPLLLAAAFLAAAGARAEQTFQQTLTQAQTEYMRGDMDAAKRDFETVLAQDPKNPVAISHLRLIQIANQEHGAGHTLEKDLAGVILPKIEFKEATFDSTLDVLKKMVARATNDKKTVNFVSQVPPEIAAKPITLSLTNVPFGEVLKYLGSLANVRFTFDKYAITVKPVGEAAAATPAAAEQGRPQQ